MAFTGSTASTYRPRSGMRLVAFRNWLFQKGRSESTATLYMAFVRTIFRSEEEAAELLASPERTTEAIFDHERVLTTNSRGTFRAAIRAFNAFWEAQGKPPFLVRPFPDGRTVMTRYAEDHPVFDSLRVLFDHVSPDRVAVLKWSDVKYGGGASGFIRDRERGYMAQVPIEDLRKINLWAGGGQPVDQSSPIVPKEPLSRFTMSVRQMRRFGTNGPLKIKL